MMRPRRLRDLELHFIARQRPAPALKQLADDGDPARIGQRLHHDVQFQILHRRMGIRFHWGHHASKRIVRQSSNYILTSAGADAKFDAGRTKGERARKTKSHLTSIIMPNLFDPVRIGAWDLPNRIVFAPLTRARAGAERIPNALMAEYYAQRATVGLIISEATAVTPTGVGYADTPGIWSAAQVEGWKLVTDSVHRAGGRMILQLWHVGRISDPMFLNGALPVAPSAIAAAGHVSLVRPLKNFVTPRALALEEIPGIIEAYRSGAANAKLAGFDGVEIHGANGYLLDQFLQDKTNRRTDAYGGPE